MMEIHLPVLRRGPGAPLLRILVQALAGGSPCGYVRCEPPAVWFVAVAFRTPRFKPAHRKARQGLTRSTERAFFSDVSLSEAMVRSSSSSDFRKILGKFSETVRRAEQAGFPGKPTPLFGNSEIRKMVRSYLRGGLSGVPLLLGLKKLSRVLRISEFPKNMS